MVTFKIRKATSKDLDKILDLNFQLFKKEWKEYNKNLNLNWTYSKKGRNYFQKRIRRSDSFLAIAEDDGKIVGYLCGSIHASLTYIFKEYAELENMMVLKNYRSKGAGKGLVKEFYKWNKQKKITNIFVSVFAANSLGINFYEKNGFKDYELVLKKKLN